MLLGNRRRRGKAAGLKPRARIRAFANIGSEPALMLTGPVDVTGKCCSAPACRIADIDLFEINEAFASVVLRYMQAFDLDPAKVNVNGGAIAMGHPLGATGAMILGTALDELERSGQVDRAGHALHRRRHGHRDDHRAGLSERKRETARWTSRISASNRRRRHRARHLGHAGPLDERHHRSR